MFKVEYFTGKEWALLQHVGSIVDLNTLINRMRNQGVKIRCINAAGEDLCA
ncbi:hypothetical protein [Agrobacterium sp. ST15.13.015]|uniref:hypothetical protein n=1 Tax=Agrobacterium sp. ST15.13.015 TaxID=3017319 RepID=UPI0022C96493|nr:hypothetical protein [Agrobacterium sp. ST15.13.015]MCZ7502000.1 hypothetical protein [Rhizobium rhizogenes]